MDTHGLNVPQFLAALVAIWIGAKLAGELAERLGQPAVLGELVVGIFLGPSALHLVPAHDHTLHLLSEVGVCILLFEVGLHTNLKEFLGAGVASTLVALVGVAVPFALGFAAIDVVEYMGWLGQNLAPDQQTLVAVFAGATLTATSVGITARVLGDLGYMRSREARIVLGAAVIDDVIGIIILAVVSALGAAVAGGVAVADAVSFGMIAKTTILAAGFLVAAVALGVKLVHPLFDLVEKMRGRGVLIVAALAFALLLAFLADRAGSAMIIGSFAAGILLAGTDKFHTVEMQLKPVADVFTPIFFVLVGAKVDLAVFTQGYGVLLAGGLLLTVAVVGKLAAGWGAAGQGVSFLAIGIGMIPRGEVGLIFAQEGLKTGLLDNTLYAAVTMMVIGTTLISPPLIAWVFRRRVDAEPATPGVQEGQPTPS